LMLSSLSVAGAIEICSSNTSFFKRTPMFFEKPLGSRAKEPVRVTGTGRFPILVLIYFPAQN
jgi:hypothetical protein